MFFNLFERAINSKGLDRRDIEYLVRSNDTLTDEQIFVFSHFLNNVRRTKVFFTKIIGDITISLKMFDIAIVYIFKNKDGKVICSMDIDFSKDTLFVSYPDTKLEVLKNLQDYKGDKSDWNDMRMRVLNEVLIRYYTHVLYSLYIDIHRR